MPDPRLDEAVPARDAGVPVCTTDPFADDFLRDPFAFHTELREAGPVVWLERYGIWGMARYGEVHEAMRDWQTYCSSAGVGLSDFRKQTPWRPPSLLLEADPPEHSRARRAVARALSPRTIRDLRDDFAREADSLVSDLLARGTVDGVTDIAEAFPLRVFPRAVGITQDCGEQLLAYGNMAFNAFGPRNHLQTQSMAQAQGVVTWIAAHCAREALTPGGLGDRIYASADEGAVSHDEAALLVRSLLTAGVDTTVIGLGCALDCLARDPAQWQLLRQDPSLAGALRGDVALRVTGPDVFPHDHPRRRSGRGQHRCGRESTAVPGRRQPGSQALARPGAVRHHPACQRPRGIRLRHPRVRRRRVRPAGRGGPAPGARPAGGVAGTGRGAGAPAQQHPERLRLPAAHTQLMPEDDRTPEPGRDGRASSPLGLHRVMTPAGVLPQAAWRLDASPALWPDEVRVAVERLNLDAASFRQLRDSTGGSAAAMRAAVCEIVADRGKMQNPVTGSGGMLTGVVDEAAWTPRLGWCQGTGSRPWSPSASPRW